MNFRAAAASCLLGSSIATAAWASGLTFQPGQWEVVREVKGGRGSPLQRDLYCVTAEQLLADPAAPLKLQSRPREGARAPQCTMGPVTMADGRMTSSASCRGPMGTIKPKFTGTYTATSFTFAGKMKMMMASATITVTGRRLGPCLAQ